MAYIIVLILAARLATRAPREDLRTDAAPEPSDCDGTGPDWTGPLYTGPG